MIVTIANRRYRLEFTPPGVGKLGDCDAPTTPNKRIRIDPSLKRYPKDLATVVIHECLHACAWPLDEQTVTQAAEDIARVLSKLDLIKE